MEVGGSRGLRFGVSDSFQEVFTFRLTDVLKETVSTHASGDGAVRQTDSDRERERRSWFLTFRCCRGSRVSDRSLVESGNCYPPAQTCESERRRESERATGRERDKERSFAHKVCRESEREQEWERLNNSSHPPLPPNQKYLAAGRTCPPDAHLSHTHTHTPLRRTWAYRHVMHLYQHALKHFSCNANPKYAEKTHHTRLFYSHTYAFPIV